MRESGRHYTGSVLFPRVDNFACGGAPGASACTRPVRAHVLHEQLLVLWRLRRLRRADAAEAAVLAASCDGDAGDTSGVVRAWRVVRGPLRVDARSGHGATPPPRCTLETAVAINSPAAAAQPPACEWAREKLSNLTRDSVPLNATSR